jgi:hypothetical protein
VSGIVAKWNIELAVLRVIHVLPGGVEVEMDDDTVREKEEGQNIGTNLSRVTVPNPLANAGWEMALDDKKTFIISAAQDDAPLEGYEMRLLF